MAAFALCLFPAALTFSCMPVISVATPFNIDLEFTTAPFGKRLLAWLIDLAVQVAYYIAFWFAVARSVNNMDGQAQAVIYTVVLGIPLALYHFLQEVFWQGQSLGKRAMGLQVVDLKGNEPTLSQYALRSALRVLDIGVFAGIPAMVSYGVTRYNQRIGDLVAGTLVIVKDARSDLSATIYRPVDVVAYQVRYPEVMRLSDRDLNGVRNFLASRTTDDNNIYISQIALRIKEVLNIQSDSEPRIFLEILLEDYNALTQGA
jgi:uncharacterized RDD family membrane protein YckC